MEAQQLSRENREPAKAPKPDEEAKTVVACCVAEQYDMKRVASILTSQGFVIDPFKTELGSQVVHIQMPLATGTNGAHTESGDVLVFPSGTVVGWGIPEKLVEEWASSTLLPAAANPHPQYIETEDLEFETDPTRENSFIRGDSITLGTKPRSDSNITSPESPQANTVLTKIAFSSGLARSTKLAVLEHMLSNYFESTRSIPSMLSRGKRIPFSRHFVLRKTGQLLSVRAQLNLYSELTDSLPDLFWDSDFELGLEGYYDQVGKALDIGIRIKTLNEKMDYAQEIASLLREQLSEQHSLRLEWIIILLIAMEVVFGLRKEWKEYMEWQEKHVVEESKDLAKA
ncbi:hypothetical protein MMC25_002251 [Agyrium rufum]|nr:hypothetical protein [Agyrium rufum]